MFYGRKAVSHEERLIPRQAIMDQLEVHRIEREKRDLAAPKEKESSSFVARETLDLYKYNPGNKTDCTYFTERGNINVLLSFTDALSQHQQQ